MTQPTSLPSLNAAACACASAQDKLPDAVGTGRWHDMVARVRMQLAKRRQRQALSGLDERLLGDIGITEEQRRIEVRKGVWE